MTTNKLFIPEKIQVGFQTRQGTYTGKLAYVIYYDQKGVLRKEKSWQSWRDKKLEPITVDNTPLEGFVLNKGVGGNRHSYGWNSRNEYIRVYDPRDFEFEISVANLLFILKECDCSKGKGLEGKFVYAWDGTELVLLPTISTDYQDSKKFTELQAVSVSAKDLVPGAVYTTKSMQTLTYVGRLDAFQAVASIGAKNHSKQHVFWNGNSFEFLKDAKKLAQRDGDHTVDNFAELADKYYKSVTGSHPVSMELRSVSKSTLNKYEDSWYYGEHYHTEIGGEIVSYYIHTTHNDKTVPVYLKFDSKLRIEDGRIVRTPWSRVAYNPVVHDVRKLHGVKEYGSSSGSYWNDYKSVVETDWFEPDRKHLFVTLESGAEYLFHGNLKGKKNAKETTDE